jgi:nucleoid-associated protein
LTGRKDLPDQINAVAIHHLQRNDNGVYEVFHGNGSVEISQTAIRLIDELNKLYARRVSKAYGKFSDDTVNYPTSVNINAYVQHTVSFDEMTLALMATLAKEAGTRAASTGGHVFFAHFQRNGTQYILVAIVNDKVSAALAADESLKDVSHLDVNGFRFAGRINLTGWAASEERYVSFIKGRGDISEYFKAFLGCDTTILNKVETASLVTALKEFADGQMFDSVKREEFMTRALDICDRDARADKPVDFSTLANELQPDDPDALVEMLADPDRALNDGFVANRRALKGLVGFKKKTSNWSVEFERKALQSGKVRFDPQLTLLRYSMSQQTCNMS